MSAQQVVAKVLTGEGIEVRWDAKVPYADLKNRIMHLRPLPDQISARELQDVRADCDHELAHFLFTDPKAFEHVRRGMVKHLANAIEDGHVERRLSERYLGCAENLRESNEHIFKELRARATRDNRRQRAMASLTLFAFGLTEINVYELLLDDFKPYIDTIRDLLPRLAAVNSTYDSVVLAEQIADRWKWDTPEPPTLEIKLIEPVKGEQSGEQKADEKPAVAPRPIDAAGEEREAKRLEHGAIATVRKRKIETMSFARSNVYRAKTDEDTEELLSSSVPSLIPIEQISPAFMADVRQIAAPLRRRLLMEFRGPGRCMARNQRKGRLDQRSLHKVALDDEHIFESEIKDIVIDRDVTLLVDCSGSMLYSHKGVPWGDLAGDPGVVLSTRLAVAAKAAAACSMVLDLIGVPNEVLGWTTHWHGRVNPLYDRVTPLRHLVVKPAGASFRACRQNFVRLGAFAGCMENIDGESLLWAALRSATRARRSGRRPVLIVFSDGTPQSSPERQDVLAMHLRSAVDRVGRAGISLLGVGIQSNEVKRFYPNWTTVDDLSDLVGRFYTILRDVIAGKKFEEVRLNSDSRV